MTRSFRWRILSKNLVAATGTTLIAAALVACAEEAVPPPPPPPPAPVAPPPVAVAAPPPAPVVEAPAPPAASDPAADALLEQHRHHHHGGVTMFIAMALDTLAVAPEEQPEVGRIEAVLADAMAAAQDAERNVFSTLADGVQAGKLEPAKVDAAVAKLSRASGVIHASTVDALVKLHATLTPLERATLADKVEAHWTVWGRVNGAGPQAAETHTGPIAELNELLGLTSDQLEKIRVAQSALPGGTAVDVKDVDDHIRAFVTAFAADSFTPKNTGVGGADDARLATAGAIHLARFCQASAPLLTPDQRTKLATHLRDHLDHSEASAAPPAGT